MVEREKSPLIFLLVVVLLGAIIRLHPLFVTNFVIDADEAIVGLMGKHIFEGRPIPVFYYGQHYMGSLEAILAAISFAFFGIHSWSLKLVPFLFSLGLIVLVYHLVREMSSQAVAKLSAFFIAVPPAALVEWSTKARGGFIEVVFLGTLAFLFTVRFLKTKILDKRNLFFASTALGIGWWVNNQVVYFMIPVAFAVGSKLLSLPITWAKRLQIVFGCCAVFLLGGLPYWVYNFQNDFISLQMFGGASGSDLLKHLSGLFSTALPILWGAKRFWHEEELFQGSVLFAYSFYGALFVWYVQLRRREILNLFRLKLDVESPLEVLVFFVLVGVTVFATSSFGYLVQAPRYLLPLYVGLFPIAAYVMCSVPRTLGIVFFSGVFSLNLLSSYLGGLSVPGEPIVHNGQRVSRDHTEILSWLMEKNIHHVRTNYWIGYRLAFESHESVTFDVFQEPHHVRIPEYELYNSEGRLLKQPIIAVESQSPMIRKALQLLGIGFKEAVKSNYVVFYDLDIPSLRKLKKIPPEQYALSSDLNPQMLPNVHDDDRATRWASSRPQAPGMEVRIAFKQPQELRFIVIDYGKFQTDFGRKLTFDVASADGKRQPMYTPDALFAVRFYIDKTDDYELLVPSGQYTDLWIRQIGSDPFFDWSIAELKLFSEEGI